MGHVFTLYFANRLVNVNGVDYTWDANPLRYAARTSPPHSVRGLRGKLLSDGLCTSTYECAASLKQSERGAANRLTWVTSGTLTTTFEYDGLGNRTAQRMDGITTEYALDVAGDPSASLRTGLPEVIVATSGGAGAGSNDGGVAMKDVYDNIKKMFAGVSLLRQRLSVDGRLEVAHSGSLWTAAFEWFSPTSTEVILETQGQLGKTLPKDYASFLSFISNGAVMFFDLQYGQWGFKIYGTSELLEKQRFWQHSLEGKWKPHFIAFAENFGDEYVMVFDLERPTSEGMSCTVVQGSPYDSVEYWLTASRSFHEWLDHLVTAQGAEYWEWR